MKGLSETFILSSPLHSILHLIPLFELIFILINLLFYYNIKVFITIILMSDRVGKYL